MARVKSEKTVVHSWVPRELATTIRDLAESEDRTASYVIARALREHFSVQPEDQPR